ncbi:uncharacterized protein PG998_013051 [Apiospora kogelbergensis]|uniref:uncharacterized protein n=1 Tax=Apiospora kogelbergensis TaxID=1337665 RepID=UPI00313010A3
MPVKWNPSSHFVPARNSRHRTACLALYKALLTVAPKVRLPPDLVTAFGPRRHPIVHHVRAAFRRNRADTSPRLVYPALQAGYRLLALLSRTTTTPATDESPSPPPSPEHAAVEAFLRARLAERDKSKASQALHPPNSRNPPRPAREPRPGTRPLLVKTSPDPTPENPFPKPKYAVAHRPLPLAELGGTGRRQVPRLEMAMDFPFLRFTKPQPGVLSRVLHTKLKKRVERQATWTRMKDEDVLDAQEEDSWEQEVAKLQRAEKQPRRDGTAGDNDGMYAATIRDHGMGYIRDMLTKEREDSVARADAMRDLIKAETALQLKEKEERRLERLRKWTAKMEDRQGAMPVQRPRR